MRDLKLELVQVNETNTIDQSDGIYLIHNMNEWLQQPLEEE